MIIGSENIIHLYEVFYSKKYESPKYKFKPTPKAALEIDKFLVYLDKRHNLLCLGQHFLNKYFAFQFKRVEGLTFKRFSSKDVAGRIQIYDIIGRKAIEYWEKRDIKFDYLIEPYCANPEKDLQRGIAEEIEKKRFFNTPRGFVNCIERTSLFNHRSTNCSVCKFKDDCKKMLKNNYVNVYTHRGYGATT